MPVKLQQTHLYVSKKPPTFIKIYYINLVLIRIVPKVELLKQKWFQKTSIFAVRGMNGEEIGEP